MPTSKPRITITLTPEQHAVLQRLAGIQEQSMSSIVVELIETALPVMERIGDVMEQAVNAPQLMLDGLRESMERAEVDVLHEIKEHMGLLATLLSGASAVDGGTALAVPPSSVLAQGTVAPQGKPPSSNRGVRITTTPHSPPQKNTASQRRVKGRSK